MEEYPSSCGEYAWKALPPTIELYEAARRSSVPVVHVTYDTRAETDGKVRPTNRQRMQPDRGFFKIKEELSPVDHELVVYKKRASAFFGTPLLAFLNEIGADSLFIVGESTSGCVRSSVVEAWSLGYPVAVVSDCVFDRSELSGPWGDASSLDSWSAYREFPAISRHSQNDRLWNIESQCFSALVVIPKRAGAMAAVSIGEVWPMIAEATTSATAGAAMMPEPPSAAAQ